MLPFLLFLSPSMEKVKWPHMSQSVILLLSGSWCMRTKMGSAETADHTHTTHVWWNTWHKYLVQDWGSVLGITWTVVGVRGGNWLERGDELQLQHRCAFRSLVSCDKAVLVSLKSLANRHFSSFSFFLKSEKKFFLQTIPCVLTSENIIMLLMCLYWKPDVHQ